ncbi:MAG: hypothetical protein Q4G58_15115 [bacterium]|nr:hypothetical protein [bacterium]
MWKLELKKMVLRPYILLSFCIAVSLFAVYLVYEPGKLEFELNKEVYKEYLKVLEGEATSQKSEYISKELENVNTIIGQEDEKEEQYLSFELEAEEYKEYLKELKIAKGKLDTLLFLEKKANSFEVESDKNVGYFYELDVQRYLRQTIWNPFSLAIVIIICFSVCLEDRIVKTESIIQTCKYGRFKLVRTRMTVAAVIALGITLIMGGLEWEIILRNCPKEVWSYSLHSLCGYETNALNVTVGMVLVGKAIVKCLVCMITAAVIGLFQVPVSR